MEYIEYLDREWAAAGFRNADSETESAYLQGVVYDNIRELVGVFDKQGHSGFSAPYVMNLFKKIALFEPIVPLTGEEDEWFSEPFLGSRQNRRCFHVFQEIDTGRAYDSKGKVFQDKDGSRWTNNESRVEITFPYTPKTEIVKVEDET